VKDVVVEGDLHKLKVGEGIDLDKTFPMDGKLLKKFCKKDDK
jgi:hypothetical protein